MALYSGNVFPNNLVVHIDVNNEKCFPTSKSPLSSNDKLYNLVKDSEISYFYNDLGTESNQSIVTHPNGFKSIVHDAQTVDTTWSADVVTQRDYKYTILCWFKFDNVNQQSENIYGGGFQTQTVFYMASGGTSVTHGSLLYSEDGNSNVSQVTSAIDANDGNWHMRAFTVDGVADGTQYYKYYVDDSKYIDTSFYQLAQTGDALMRLMSWSTTYGNVNGEFNNFMYFNRALSEEEILSVYKNTYLKYKGI